MSEPKKEWYVVNTYAGHENRVKENLERRIETMGLQDFLFQIVVAEEKEIEYKNGKEVEKTKNLFSGYLFVQMIMTDEAWYIVRNTPGVTGFIGSSGGGAKPFPVAEEEMENILRRLGRAQEVAKLVAFLAIPVNDPDTDGVPPTPSASGAYVNPEAVQVFQRLESVQLPTNQWADFLLSATGHPVANRQQLNSGEAKKILKDFDLYYRRFTAPKQPQTEIAQF